MNKYNTLLMIGITALLSAAWSQAKTITPEITTEIELSNKDINRLVCTNGLINDVYYSKEKGLVVTTDKESAYIKYLIQDNGTTKKHVTQRTEFFVICGGETYTLLANPKSNLSSQTYRLGNPYKSKVKNNNRVFKGVPDEEKAIEITKRLYRNDVLDLTPIKNETYEKSWHTNVIPNAEITLHRAFRLDGHGMTIKEYRVRSLNDPLLLQEIQFLNTFFGSHIFSVTVIPQKIQKDQISQVFIVERGAGND